MRTLTYFPDARCRFGQRPRGIRYVTDFPSVAHPVARRIERRRSRISRNQLFARFGAGDPHPPGVRM
jgi:hypothetical protein